MTLDADPQTPAQATAQAYAEFAPYVRLILLQLGVRDADLDDVCHEVFLVVHHKSERLDEIERLDLWLREICRRVAAGYRRRASQKHEVLSQAPEQASSAAPTTDEPEGREQVELVRLALSRLDDESRDLLALHAVGELPLTELARLVERDRKTVRKRLDLARRRLSALMRAAGSPPPGGERRQSPRPVVTAPGGPEGPPSAEPVLGDFEVITVSPDLKIGLIGNVVVTDWPGTPTLRSFETLQELGPRVIANCGGKIGYLAVVEATVRPPPFPARRKIVELLDMMGPSVLGYATGLLGGMAWIAQPVMTGMMLLARPRFPMRFFSGFEPAAAWLCAHWARGPNGPLEAADLCAAVELLRGMGG